VAARSVTRGGQSVDLTPREFALLECLAVHAGEVVSRTEIESRIYDEQAEPMSNVVDAAIYALRKKVDAPGQPSLIETRRGMGYILRSQSAATTTTSATAAQSQSESGNGERRAV
jgi:DNA-binding response OmpR family regulator